MAGFPEMTFQLKIDPILNAQKLNAILNELAKSMGALGKDIKPIDEAKLTEAFRKIDEQAKKTGSILGSAFEDTKDDVEGLGKEVDVVNSKLKKVPESVSSAGGSVRSIIGGVFGGGLLLGGFEKLIGSFNDTIQRGLQLDQTMDVIGTAFTQAGIPIEKSAQAVEDVMKRTADLSTTYAYPVEKLNEFAATAAALGGATGKTNEDLVKLAMAVSEVTNGMVDGNMVIRMFSKGVADPETALAMNKLITRFPALGTAIKDIKDPALATSKALEVLNPTLNSMKDMGANDSITVLKNNMIELQNGISKVILSAIIPTLNAFKSTILPIMKVVTNAFQGIASALQPLTNIIAPVVVALGSLSVALIAAAAAQRLFKAATAEGGIIQSAIQMKDNLMQLVVQTYKQVAAQGVLNTVMSINPYVAAIAGVTALVTGLHYLSDALHTTAVERGGELEAEKKAMDSQIEMSNKQLEAAKAKANLINQFEEEGQSALSNANMLRDLAQAYPGVIDLTKSYSENLEVLRQKSIQVKTEISTFEDNLTKLKEKQLDIDVKISMNEVAISKESVEDELTNYFSRISWDNIANGAGFGDKIQEFLFGTSGARKAAENIVKNYSDAMYKAKNSADLLKVQNEFYNDLYNTEKFSTLDASAKQRLLDKMDKMFKEQGEAMQKAKDKNKEILSVNLSGILDKAFSGIMPTAKDFQTLIKRTGGDIKTAFDEFVKLGAEQINKGKDAEIVYQALAKATGKTPSEIKNAINQQQILTKEIKQSEIAMMDLGQATQALTENQQNARNAIIKAIADYKQGRISQKQMNEEIAKQKGIIQENAAQMKNFNEAAKDKTVLDINKMIVNDETKIQSEKKATSQVTKDQITLYEKMKREYETQASTAREILENEKLNRQLLLLQNNINLTLHEQSLQKISDIEKERQINENNYKIYKNIYDKVKEQYDMELKRGKLSDKIKQDYDDAKKTLEGINKTLIQSQITELQLKTQVVIDKDNYTRDIEKLQYDISKSSLELNVKLGLANNSDLLQIEVEELRRQIQNLYEINLSVGIDEKLYLDNKNKILQLQARLYEANNKLAFEKEKEKANLIEDETRRSYELQVIQAKEVYEQELKNARNNNNLKLIAQVKYYDAINQLEQQHLLKTNFYKKTFVDTINSITNAFTNLNIEINTTQENDERLSNFKEQQSSLVSSLKNQTLAYTDFVNQMNELDKQRKEQVIKTNNEIITAINNALKDAFKQTIDATKNAMQNTLKEYTSYSNAVRQIEEEEKRIKSDISIKTMEEQIQLYAKLTELSERKLEIEKKQQESLRAAYYQTSTVIGSTFLQLIADGKSAQKSLVMSALAGLKALVPILSAKILGYSLATADSIASLGTTALLKWGILTGILTGAVSAAEAAVNRAKFYKGVVNLNGPGTPTSDSIPAKLSRGESVIPASATRNNIKELTYLLTNNKNLIHYYKEREPQALKQAYMEIATAKDFLSFVPVINLMLEERKMSNSEINSLKKELQIMNEKLDLLTAINTNIEKGNYSRKSNTSVDLNIEVDDTELIKRIKRQDLMSIRRS